VQRIIAGIFMSMFPVRGPTRQTTRKLQGSRRGGPWKKVYPLCDGWPRRSTPCRPIVKLGS
jgi:hypothetical protein